MQTYSPQVTAIISLLQTLPETTQNQVVEHLQEYLAELQHELVWDNLFTKTQDHLVAAAQRAKQEIGEGKAEPMDFDPASTHSLRPTFGAMQGSGQVLGDAIAPVDESWEVLG